MYIERGGERERGLNVLFLQHYKKKRKKNAFSFPCFSFALCCSVFFFFLNSKMYILERLEFHRALYQKHSSLPKKKKTESYYRVPLLLWPNERCCTTFLVTLTKEEKKRQQVMEPVLDAAQLFYSLFLFCFCFFSLLLLLLFLLNRSSRFDTLFFFLI